MKTEQRYRAIADATKRWTDRKKAEDMEAWRANRREIQRRYRAKNAAADAAHQLVTRGVAAGRITRPDACSNCGKQGPVEASHDDYNKPDEYEWLCRQCHANKDRKN